MLVTDLTKRYGNLKNGVNDIKNHRWYSGMDWTKLISRLIEAPHKPTIKSPNDTSNFSEYPDSDEVSPPIGPEEDPFIDWWLIYFFYNFHRFNQSRTI